MVTVKVSTTDICDLTPIQVRERAVTKHVFLRLPVGNVWGNLWLAVNVVWSIWTNEIFLVGQGVLQMSQISRSCIIVSMSH